MQVFSRLVCDLINAIKQKSATFLDGARVNYKDLLLVPEYIYDETSHAADVTRNVLVLDNLEEKQYFASVSGNLAVKTINLKIWMFVKTKFCIFKKLSQAYLETF